MHARQSIREAVAAALVAAGTDAGSRVFESRMSAIDDDTELPAVCVYTLNEQVIAEGSRRDRHLKRVMQLMIEGYVIADDDVDDAVDDLSEQIEAAMHANETFPTDAEDPDTATANDAVLASCEIELGQLGNRPVASVQIVYSVTYYTNPNDTPITEIFDKAFVEVNLADAQAQAESANDQITDINEE